MSIYEAKAKTLPGSTYGELVHAARKHYHAIQRKTPRRVPYVRSPYFRKEKIFVNNFWDHLSRKNGKDRTRRLKLYPCAIELIRHGKFTPDSYQNPNNKNEMLHRFHGVSKYNVKFSVQIKENKATHRKDFISVFPTK